MKTLERGNIQATERKKAARRALKKSKREKNRRESGKEITQSSFLIIIP